MRRIVNLSGVLCTILATLLINRCALSEQTPLPSPIPFDEYLKSIPAHGIEEVADVLLSYSGEDMVYASSISPDAKYLSVILVSKDRTDGKVEFYSFTKRTIVARVGTITKDGVKMFASAALWSPYPDTVYIFMRYSDGDQNAGDYCRYDISRGDFHEQGRVMLNSLLDPKKKLEILGTRPRLRVWHMPAWTITKGELATGTDESGILGTAQDVWHPPTFLCQTHLYSYLGSATKFIYTILVEPSMQSRYDIRVDPVRPDKPDTYRGYVFYDGDLVGRLELPLPCFLSFGMVVIEGDKTVAYGDFFRDARGPAWKTVLTSGKVLNIWQLSGHQGLVKVVEGNTVKYLLLHGLVEKAGSETIKDVPQQE